jgi:hypothetical protein
MFVDAEGRSLRGCASCPGRIEDRGVDREQESAERASVWMQ